MEKIVTGIIALVIGLMMISGVLPSVIDSSVSEEYSENFDVTTGVGENSAICTLDYAHYYDDLRNLSAISDNTSDSPTVMDYNSGAQQVTVANLVASDNRILTVDYYRERTGNGWEQWVAFIGWLPFLLGIALIWYTIKPLFGR